MFQLWNALPRETHLAQTLMSFQHQAKTILSTWLLKPATLKPYMAWVQVTCRITFSHTICPTHSGPLGRTYFSQPKLGWQLLPRGPSLLSPPRLWNGLPEEIRKINSPSEFKTALKTSLIIIIIYRSWPALWMVPRNGLEASGAVLTGELYAPCNIPSNLKITLLKLASNCSVTT